MNITRISAIASIAGALVTAALTLAGPAVAAGAGGHDRPRGMEQVTSADKVGYISQP